MYDALVQDLRGVAVANGYPVDIGTVYVNSVNPGTRAYPCAEVIVGPGNEEPLDIGDRHTDSRDSFLVRLWRSGEDAQGELLDCKDAVRTAIRRGAFGALAVSLLVSWEPPTDIDETVATAPQGLVLTIEPNHDFTVDGG